MKLRYNLYCLTFIFMNGFFAGCEPSNPHNDISSKRWDKIVINYTLYDPSSIFGVTPPNNKVVITDPSSINLIKSLYGNPKYSYMTNTVDMPLGNVEVHLDDDEVWVFEFVGDKSAVVHPLNNHEPSFNVIFGNEFFAQAIRDDIRNQLNESRAQFYTEYLWEKDESKPEGFREIVPED